INSALSNSPGQAIELDATSGLNGFQDLLAPGSLNFSNVPKASPAINTSQLPTSATVGTSISDKATVTGGFNPTGTVTFNLYSNATATRTPLFTAPEPLTGRTPTTAT